MITFFADDSTFAKLPKDPNDHPAASPLRSHAALQRRSPHLHPYRCWLRPQVITASGETHAALTLIPRPASVRTI